MRIGVNLYVSNKRVSVIYLNKLITITVFYQLDGFKYAKPLIVNSIITPTISYYKCHHQFSQY